SFNRLPYRHIVQSRQDIHTIMKLERVALAVECSTRTPCVQAPSIASAVSDSFVQSLPAQQPFASAQFPDLDLHPGPDLPSIFAEFTAREKPILGYEASNPRICSASLQYN